MFEKKRKRGKEITTDKQGSCAPVAIPAAVEHFDIELDDKRLVQLYTANEPPDDDDAAQCVA